MLPAALAVAAAVILSWISPHALAQEGLPTAWTQGIATFYGGAPDHMVILDAVLFPFTTTYTLQAS